MQNKYLKNFLKVIHKEIQMVFSINIHKSK